MRSRGFTLIEVMIVVVVIGILAAIAYPAYTDYINKSRRADGHAALMAAEAELHKVRSAGNAYSTASITTNSADGFYTVALTASSATGYTLTATAQGAQAGDTPCRTMTIVRSSDGTTAYQPSDCWSK